MEVEDKAVSEGVEEEREFDRLREVGGETNASADDGGLRVFVNADKEPSEAARLALRCTRWKKSYEDKIETTSNQMNTSGTNRWIFALVYGLFILHKLLLESVIDIKVMRQTRKMLICPLC